MLTVGLVQINNSFSGQSYLPYAAACLESYVLTRAADPGSFSFLLPLYRRLPAREAVEHLSKADVVGFSTYVWNERLSLEIARRLKASRTGVRIVFGGPQVPDDSEAFLREHPFVDVAVHGEGEATFLDLLQAPPGAPLAEIDGISFLDPSGRFVRTAPRARLSDLATLPSPYLSGRLDALMAGHPEEAWIGLWETNRGCPFSCTFCDWGSATAMKVSSFDMDRLLGELEWFAGRRIEYVFCCDANFGILARDVDLAAHAAAVRARTGYPRGLSVQNTKNATERAYRTQKILSDAGLNKGVALSMQSLDAGTLKAVRRDNISLGTFLELQQRFTRDRVETYSDLILGLPEETYGSWLAGIELLLESGQHSRIQFNNLSLLPNAEMSRPESRARYGLGTVSSEIINVHGVRAVLDDDVPEVQELVVATAALPPEDWRRARALAWTTSLFHHDKLFQLPILLARHLAGTTYGSLLRGFTEIDPARFPLLHDIQTFFLSEAAAIQEGGPEYVYSPDWLGIFWPADEYVFIRMTAKGELDAFYREAHRRLLEIVGDAPSVPARALEDAVALNRALVRQPFVADVLEVGTEYDVLGFVRGILQGEPKPLEESPRVVRVDRRSPSWDDFGSWCREVVWWGNKKGAYLYGSDSVEVQLAGHY